MQRYERFAAMIEGFSLKRAKVITTESTFAVAFLKKHYPHLQVNQAEHASNWLFHQLHRQPQTSPIRFLCVGTIDYRKGTDLLLRGLSRLMPKMDFELVIISGPNHSFIEPLKLELPPSFGLVGNLKCICPLPKSRSNCQKPRCFCFRPSRHQPQRGERSGCGRRSRGGESNRRHRRLCSPGEKRIFVHLQRFGGINRHYPESNRTSSFR